MSKLKKLGSLLFALVFAIGMTCTALADSTTYTAMDKDSTYTITIDKETEGYTYVAYQIFTGDLATKTVTDDEGKETSSLVLSNVVFGSALSETDQAALLSHYNVSSAAELAEALADGDITAEAFAKQVATYTLSSGTTSEYDAEAKEYTITVSGVGYYLVVNTGIAGGTSQSYSNYIVQVVSDVKVNTKDDTIPTFDKEVTSTTDEDKETTADYDVGDDVPFTLTATLPASYSAFDTYKLVFHDTLSDGLTFKDDVKVVAGSTTLSRGTDYTVDSTVNEDKTTTITITITNLKAVDGLELKAKDTVVVTYTAKLNDNAETTEYNDAYLEYSNNPNDSSKTGTTPEDKTYVVTFTLNVDKTDGKNALEGAGFTLSKKNESDEYVAVGSEITDVTTFTFDGLAIGEYKLSETTTPAGYNTAEDLYFTISATTSENEDTDVVTTTVTIYAADGETVLNTEDNTATFSVDGTTISTTVVNNEGSILPSTGGIGTTLFYVIGGVLVVGAAVLLITKVRMSDEE